jgi:hypothetical protein
MDCLDPFESIISSIFFDAITIIILVLNGSFGKNKPFKNKVENNIVSFILLQHVIFKGDALEIIRTLRKEGHCWRQYRQLINDAKTMWNCFQSWLLSALVKCSHIS